VPAPGTLVTNAASTPAIVRNDRSTVEQESVRVEVAEFAGGVAAVGGEPFGWSAGGQGGHHDQRVGGSHRLSHGVADQTPKPVEQTQAYHGEEVASYTKEAIRLCDEHFHVPGPEA